MQEDGKCRGRPFFLILITPSPFSIHNFRTFRIALNLHFITLKCDCMKTKCTIRNMGAMVATGMFLMPVFLSGILFAQSFSSHSTPYMRQGTDSRGTPALQAAMPASMPGIRVPQPVFFYNPIQWPLPALNKPSYPGLFSPGLKPETGKKIWPNTAIIYGQEGARRKGILVKAEEDKIWVCPSNHVPHFLNSPMTVMPQTSYAVTIPEINSLHLLKKNTVGKSALIGMGAGMLTGIVVGLISGDDPTYEYQGNNLGELLVVEMNNMWALSAGEKATVGALLGGMAGAGIGALVGSGSGLTIEIGGDRQAYKRELETIRLKALIQ